VQHIVGVEYTENMSDPRVRRESAALAQRGDQVIVLSLREAHRPDRRWLKAFASAIRQVTDGEFSLLAEARVRSIDHA
jgi:hypothetical protein